MNLSVMGLVAAQAVCGGKPAAKSREVRKNLVGPSPARNAEAAVVGAKIYLITLSEAELADEIGRQSDGERISPLGNLQWLSPLRISIDQCISCNPPAFQACGSLRTGWVYALSSCQGAFRALSPLSPAVLPVG